MNRLLGIAWTFPLICAVPLVAAMPEAAAQCEARSLDFGDKAVGWAHQPLSKLKRDTDYTLATQDGRTVLRAAARRLGLAVRRALQHSPPTPAQT